MNAPATVRAHYETTAKALNAETGWTVQNADGSQQILVHGKISYYLEESTRHWSFYFPEGCNLGHVEYILRMPDTARCVITEDVPVAQIVGFADSPERHSPDSLPFSGRVYLYIDEWLTASDKDRLIVLGNGLGLGVVIRDKNFVKEHAELATPLAFISHDSRDKDSLVRALAYELASQLCPVWYDEYSLKVGDSLRASIERGLRESKKCIVVLSPNFVSNGGWTKAEFDSIYVR